MGEDSPEGHQRGQEQRLVGNGLLQVTVTTHIFRKWWVDCASPYNERMFFLDGVSLDGIDTPFYVRAWWVISLSELTLFEELDIVPMNSILKLSSSRCSIEPAEDFLLTGEESQEQAEGGPAFCLGMKAPTLKRLDSRKVNVAKLKPWL